MSVDMYLSASKTQASGVTTQVTTIKSGCEALIKAIASFQLEIGLSGQAYDSAKRYFGEVLSPLAQATILLVETIDEACQKFPEEYVSQVYETSLKESELRMKILNLDAQIQQLEARIDTLRNTIRSAKEPDEFNYSIMGILTNSFLVNGHKDARQELQKMLDDLLTFNGSSPAIFSEIGSLKSLFDQGSAQANSAWNSASGTFRIDKAKMGWATEVTKKIYIKKAQKEYKEYLEKYPDDLDKIITIIKYEELHPEYVKTTNKFLSPLELKDKVETKFIIYTAKEPYRVLCLKYMDEFEIVSINESGVFNSGKNTLIFDVLEDRTNPRGKYYTFFHEMGHAIDYYYAEDNRNFFENLFSGAFFSDNFKYDGKSLSEYNVLDVSNNLKKTMADILKADDFKNLSDKEKKQMINNVTNNLLNQNNNYPDLSRTEKKIQDLLEIEYENNKLSGAENESASDIYGGVTNLTIDKNSNYGHHDDDMDFSTGTYWYDGKGNIIRETNKESFAEYFGRKMVADPEHSAGLGSMDTYLPESKECLDKMLEEMGRGNSYEEN